MEDGDLKLRQIEIVERRESMQFPFGEFSILVGISLYDVNHDRRAREGEKESARQRVRRSTIQI